MDQSARVSDVFLSQTDSTSLNMSDTDPPISGFRDLNLPAPLLTALNEVGYETPTPIQIQAIPHLRDGLDLLGRAPSGTGKTAAFALPLLARLSLEQPWVQVMVLTPTRELAIQVAEAFQRYAAHLRGFHVLPIYGGQDYAGQIRQLDRGMHVVVGTPGRVMDHLRRGTLTLDNLQAFVLDEADEMLRMGFIDDVEWILDQMPNKQRQMALFSATIPTEIQRIARRYLRDPKEIAIRSRTATAETIHQRYWLVSDLHKLDALTRILEVESFDALLIFVRTKTATTELAERLEARGYRAAALNGDMVQKNREQMIERLKRARLDILVATDVAARGLDVDRVSHVVNYDIPYDIETYIHRIGRTGRAGRPGEAILFVSPRERRILAAIEKATRQRIELLELPSTEMVNNKRIADFKQKISNTLAADELDFMRSLLGQYQREHDVPALEIAAALAKMFIGNRRFLLKPEKEGPTRPKTPPRQRQEREPRERKPRERNREDDRPRHREREQSPRNKPRTKPPKGMERFRIEVGRQHDVKPGNIVGAIANEAGLDSRDIGYIDIQAEFSLVDLPKGMPNDIFQDLGKIWVHGRRLNISRQGQSGKKKKDKRETKKRKHQ
uniref:ATP-dependent RNA helicase DeaD n=1 Tax=Candidatus Kentrum sp. TC TaxID=2126339 RepID=A0A450ZBT0_9GAMM|nr:MAG: ATP-dependent RNA helicase CsdA [Candidatus Kentron sp. TC]